MKYYEKIKIKINKYTYLSKYKKFRILKYFWFKLFAKSVLSKFNDCFLLFTLYYYLHVDDNFFNKLLLWIGTNCHYMFEDFFYIYN